MIPDLTNIFKEYENLRLKSDRLFSHMSDKFPQCIVCKAGCSDCCHALFDLSFVEAMYINKAFAEKFKYGRERSQILERASELDRELTRIKKKLFQEQKNGVTPDDIMKRVAEIRMPCPLLTENNHCLLYEDRPITCRLYGVPIEIGGQSYVCGLARFKKGIEYPAVHIGKIQKMLEELSAKIAKEVDSRFELENVYIPLSMALLTRYDEAYLGIGEQKEDN